MDAYCCKSCERVGRAPWDSAEYHAHKALIGARLAFIFTGIAFAASLLLFIQYL
jgi:hypothetical protein